MCLRACATKLGYPKQLIGSDGVPLYYESLDVLLITQARRRFSELT